MDLFAGEATSDTGIMQPLEAIYLEDINFGHEHGEGAEDVADVDGQPRWASKVRFFHWLLGGSSVVVVLRLR